MKTIYYSLYLISLFLLISACSNGPSFDSYDDDNTKGVELADPYIIYVDSIYYAYGTTGSKCFYVYSSEDLINWYKHEQPALNLVDSYGEIYFWAPEVYYNSEIEKYIMFYSSEEKLCIAFSDSPLGPFKQTDKQPLFSFKSIDPTLFTDDNNEAYLYFINSEEVNDVWVQPMNKNGITKKNIDPIYCFGPSQHWEYEYGSINEGVFVIKHKGYFYMIYSGCGYESPNYAIGYAIAEHPFGPWKKYEHNPILHKPLYNGKVLEGTGHGSIFTDKEGNLRLVFHAHKLPGIVEPRNMYITTVHFTNDPIPVMYFGEDIIRPICVGTK